MASNHKEVSVNNIDRKKYSENYDEIDWGNKEKIKEEQNTKEEEDE